MVLLKVVDHIQTIIRHLDVDEGMEYRFKLQANIIGKSSIEDVTFFS